MLYATLNLNVCLNYVVVNVAGIWLLMWLNASNICFGVKNLMKCLNRMVKGFKQYTYLQRLYRRRALVIELQ